GQAPPLRLVARHEVLLGEAPTGAPPVRGRSGAARRDGGRRAGPAREGRGVQADGRRNLSPAIAPVATAETSRSERSRRPGKTGAPSALRSMDFLRGTLPQGRCPGHQAHHRQWSSAGRGASASNACATHREPSKFPGTVTFWSYLPSTANRCTTT